MDLGNLLNGIDVEKVGKAVEVVAKLPEYLGKVADGLEGAGGQAKAAAVSLVGDDGKSGIREALAASAAALETIVTAVGAGADRIGDAAEAAAKVPLMDGPASRLAAAATEMTGATGKLGELAAAMETISATLAEVGKSLDQLGDHLVETSGSARSFADLA